MCVCDVACQIMNPEKMRTEYGKLVYMLQDSVSPYVRARLEFDCVREVTTVRSVPMTHRHVSTADTVAMLRVVASWALVSFGS